MSKADRQQRKAEAARTRERVQAGFRATEDQIRGTPSGKFSDQAVKDADGTAHCPVCGGTQFKAQRDPALGWLLVGIGTLLAPKSVVRCETCGVVFGRG